MKRNDFCINTKESGCVWGELSNWQVVELARKLHPLHLLGIYNEYNGRKYVVLRAEESGINYIVEII